MKIILCIITLSILSVNVYSQKGFYLHPVIENKTDVNKSYPSEVVTVKGNTFQIKPINLYNDLGTVNWGVHLGYHTKKMFYEIGWSTDRALAAARASAWCRSNDSTYFLDEVKSSTRIPLNKFPMRIGFKIAGRDSIAPGKYVRWQCFFYLGVDLLRIASTATKPSYTHNFIIAPNQYARYESIAEIFLAKRNSKTLGFMIKAYNKRGKNIFNAGIHYSLGSKDLLFNGIILSNYDGTSYGAMGSESKASGLYISISKDIYPKNIIKGTKLPKIF